MKYYTLIIKTYNNGTEDKTSLYTYSTIDEAMAAAHTQFGQNVGAETIKSIMCTVLNSVGSQFEEHTLYWAQPEEPVAE